MGNYWDFTEKLESLLNTQKRSQSWLAEELGVSSTTVNRWLNYENRPGSAEMVERIAEVFGITDIEGINELLVLAGYPKKSHDLESPEAPETPPDVINPDTNEGEVTEPEKPPKPPTQETNAKNENEVTGDGVKSPNVTPQDNDRKPVEEAPVDMISVAPADKFTPLVALTRNIVWIAAPVVILLAIVGVGAFSGWFGGSDTPNLPATAPNTTDSIADNNEVTQAGEVEQLTGENPTVTLVSPTATEQAETTDTPTPTITPFPTPAPDDAVAHNSRGVFFMEQGEYGLAVSDFAKAIELDLDYIAAYANRAKAYITLGKYHPAITDLAKVIDDNPDNSNIYLERGSIYLALGEYGLALADYEKAIELEPNNARAYNAIGDLHYVQDEFDLAIEAYTKAIERNIVFAAPYLSRGVIYRYESDEQETYGMALVDLIDVVALEQDSIDAYTEIFTMLDISLEYTGRLLRGTKTSTDIVFDKANLLIEQYPQGISSNILQGMIYYYEAEQSEDSTYENLAITKFDEIVENYPNLISPYYARGIIYYRKSLHDSAIIEFTRMINLDKNSAIAYASRGWAYLASGNSDLALEDYYAAISLTSNAPNRRTVNGLLRMLNREIYDFYMKRASNYYYDQGKYELALTDVNNAIKLNPEGVSGYLTRSNIYQTLEQYELSLEDNNLIIELNPDVSTYYVHRGILHFKTGDTTLALEDFNKSIELEPYATQGYEWRGRVYSFQNKYRLALDDFNHVLQQAPNSAYTYYLRGQLYEKQGDYELALSDYQRALEIKIMFQELTTSERKKVEVRLKELQQKVQVDS